MSRVQAGCDRFNSPRVVSPEPQIYPRHLQFTAAFHGSSNDARVGPSTHTLPVPASQWEPPGGSTFVRSPSTGRARHARTLSHVDISWTADGVHDDDREPEPQAQAQQLPPAQPRTVEIEFVEMARPEPAPWTSSFGAYIAEDVAIAVARSLSGGSPRVSAARAEEAMQAPAAHAAEVEMLMGEVTALKLSLIHI